MGNTEDAVRAASKSIDITPEIAGDVIQVQIVHNFKWLISEKVSFIVAPYEADAQMVYLEKTGKVDAIFTEDSDLLVFGCKRVLSAILTLLDCSKVG